MGAKKHYVLNKMRFVQLDIQLNIITHIFLVPEDKEYNYYSYLRDCFAKYHFSVRQVMEDAKEQGYDPIHYMCTLDENGNVVNCLSKEYD